MVPSGVSGGLLLWLASPFSRTRGLSVVSLTSLYPVGIACVLPNVVPLCSLCNLDPFPISLVLGFEAGRCMSLVARGNCW